MIGGFVANRPQVRTTSNGKIYVTWSVAVAKKKNPQGESETQWTNCKAWGDAARVAQTIPAKSQVLCFGNMDTYTGSDGKQYKNLVCEGVYPMSAFLPIAGQAQQTQQANEQSLEEFEEILSDGEVPF